VSEELEDKQQKDETNWQPLVDALAPHAAELIKSFIERSHEASVGKATLEKYIIGLGALVVIVVGGCSVVAAFQGNYDPAERLLIPLISFAGGLGIGARLSGGGNANKI